MFDAQLNAGFRPIQRALVALALGAGLASFAGAAEPQKHWVPLGPVGGRIHLLAQSPSDPQRLYAATERLGLFRSRDGGGSWQSVVGGIEGSIFQLTVAPDDPDVVLVGTYRSSPIGQGLNQIWRSQDGGATWTAASRPPKSGRYTLTAFDLKFAPGTPRTVYAATEKGIFRSLDDGSVWDSWALSNLTVGTFSRSEQTPGVWFAVAYNPDGSHGAIFRSDDDGLTWRETPSVGGPGENQLPERLFFRAGALYAKWNGALYRSTDGATTWSLAARLPTLYGLDFTFAPSGAIYAATDTGVYFSTDGTHWSPPEVSSADQASPRDGISGLAVVAGDSRPGSETVIAAGRRGLWRSNDRGGSWRIASRGITAQDVFSLTVIPNPQGTLIGNFRDGLHRIDRAGGTWQRLPTQAGYELPILAVDPHHPGRLYALARAGIGMSEDRGNSWRTVGEIDHSDIVSLTVDPVRPDVLYAGITLGQASSENGFAYRSVDGGATWTEILSFDYLLAVTFDRAHPNVGYRMSYQGLAKSVDGGDSWTPLPNFGEQVMNGFPSAMLLDSRSGALYVGTEETGIFRSTDSGRTFRPVNGGLPRLPGGHKPIVSTLVQDAAGDIYAGLAHAGVFRLSRGQGWKPVNRDLPLATFSGLLAADPERPGRLYAGTEGSSVLRLENL